MTSDLWVDLFEPQHLNEMIGQTELVNACKEYVRTKNIPNMTIAGAPGCGKTLLMKCFATDLGYIKYEDGKLKELIPGQFFLMDSSSDRGIDYVRETIKRISRKPTVSGLLRLIVLDEFNYKDEAQAAMRATMQECSDKTRFILLSNDPSNIIDAIVSRCPIKIAQPLTFSDMKTMLERIQKSKEFKISPEAVELLFKFTMGDMRAFIGQLQDACLISNFNVQIQHIQSVSVDVQTAKSILEAAQINFDQAREVMMTIFMKTMLAKPLINKLYDATYITKFNEHPETNKIMAMRLREKIANADFAITQNTNQFLQLDAIINYIQLMKYIPLTCPKAR